MSEKLLQNRIALMKTIIRISLEAGEIIREYFDMEIPNQTFIKEDGSPVSLADRAAEEIIDRKLARLISGIPIIGEETFKGSVPDDFDREDYFWLVDPLDGTKNFLEGSEEFTVNIALIHNREPVLGVIYAPALELVYAGTEGKAIKQNLETGTEKQIHTRKMPREGLTILESVHHSRREKLEEFLTEQKINKIVKKGSSLKFCTVAEGKADIYPNFGQTCEWDTAAGHAIIDAAGGKVTTLEGKPFLYGKTEENLFNGGFCTMSGDVTIFS